LNYVDDKGLSKNVNVTFYSSFTDSAVSLEVISDNADQVIGIANIDSVMGDNVHEIAAQQLARQGFSVHSTSLYEFAGADSTNALFGKDELGSGKKPFLFISGREKGIFHIPIAANGRPVPTASTIVVLDQSHKSLAMDEITIYGWPEKK
jgi:hypothetical protein